MLVLSRQRDESIMIGDKVVVTIVDIRGDKVRLGIEAPEEIPVHRQEVYDAIQRENQRANQLVAERRRGVGQVSLLPCAVGPDQRPLGAAGAAFSFSINLLGCTRLGRGIPTKKIV